MSSRFVEIHTRAEDKERGQYLAYWKTEHRTGTVRVQVRLSISDPTTLAELWALRYLLIDEEVAGTDRSGSGLTLHVSRGAIRKLFRMQSSKRDLVPYAHWLTVRFVGADVVVAKRLRDPDAFLAGRLAKEPVHYPSDGDALVVTEDSNPDDLIRVRGIGDVRLTHHAVERYAQHTGIERIVRSWKRLKRKLRTAQLQPASLPRHARTRKALRYEETAEHYRADDWYFVFIPDAENANLKTLVTVFHRQDV